MEIRRARIDRRSHRLIAARHPTVGPFERVAAPEDLAAVLELEGWTDDFVKSALGRLHHLPRADWAIGSRGATLVMAAFCYPAPGGGRFNDARLGCWYAAFDLATAIAETVHHHSRRLLASELGCRARIQMREVRARLTARFHDIRGLGSERPELYDPDSYERSQAFAAALRAEGANGLLYDSVRHPRGVAAAVFKPRLVRAPTRGWVALGLNDKPGLAGSLLLMGAVRGDFDRDGWPDIFLFGYGRSQLLRNAGGAFEDVSEPELADTRFATAATFLDFDRDGWLDLFVGNYVAYPIASAPPCSSNASTPPPVRCWRRASARCGNESSPG